MLSRHSIAICSAFSFVLSIGVTGCRTHVQSSSVKVVGGIDAKKGQFPAALFIGNCSATRISNQVVMTAAHCISEGEVGFRTVLVSKGDTMMISSGVDREDGETINVTVNNVWIHPTYLGKKNIGKIAERIKSKKVEKNELPDLALIWMSKFPRDSKIATIVSAPLTPGETIAFTGYGCTRTPDYVRPDVNVGGGVVSSAVVAQQDNEYKLRWKKVPFNSYFNAVGVIENVDPFQDQLVDPTSRFSGCPGDSGSAVYRAESDSFEHLQVVGVNSFIDFSASFFARLDSNYGADLLAALNAQY